MLIRADCGFICIFDLNIHKNNNSTDNQDKQLYYIEIEDLNTKEFRITGSTISTLMISGHAKIDRLCIENSKIKKLIIKTIEPIAFNLKGENTIGVLEIRSPIQQFSIVQNIDTLPTSTIAQNNKTVIQVLDLKFSNELVKGSTIIMDVNIETLNISGIHNGDTLFKNVICVNLHMENFSNIGDFRFHNANFISSFVLQDTSLGKSEFMKIQFEENIICEIDQSNIGELFLSNTIFPNNIKSKTGFSGVRETYRQLKYGASKQNDRIHELTYESLEIEAFKCDNNANKTLGDRFILFTNKWSNNYGQDWTYAMGWLFLFTVPIFLMIKLFMGYHFVWGVPEPKEIAQYLNFAFNPLHDYDKVFQTQSNLDYGMARLIDTLSKLISGYLIFQFLRAFRKYVK